MHCKAQGGCESAESGEKNNIEQDRRMLIIRSISSFFLDFVQSNCTKILVFLGSDRKISCFVALADSLKDLGVSSSTSVTLWTRRCGI